MRGAYKSKWLDKLKFYFNKNETPELSAKPISMAKVVNSAVQLHCTKRSGVYRGGANARKVNRKTQRFTGGEQRRAPRTTQENLKFSKNQSVCAWCQNNHPPSLFILGTYVNEWGEAAASGLGGAWQNLELLPPVSRFQGVVYFLRSLFGLTAQLPAGIHSISHTHTALRLFVCTVIKATVRVTLRIAPNAQYEVM